jgi:hypothetical protein
MSRIKTFELSFDGLYWQSFQAADGVLDELSEEIRLTLPEEFADKQSISIRATDEAGNAVVRTVSVP